MKGWLNNMKIHDIVALITKHGKNATMEEVLKAEMGDRVYICPNCNGKGVIQKKYNAYPRGLPDSDWVFDWRYKNIQCGLCDGEGYTIKKFVPKMTQDGWIEE